MGIALAGAVASAYGLGGLADVASMVTGGIVNGHQRQLENHSDRVGLESGPLKTSADTAKTAISNSASGAGCGAGGLLTVRPEHTNRRPRASSGRVSVSEIALGGPFSADDAERRSVAEPTPLVRPAEPF